MQYIILQKDALLNNFVIRYRSLTKGTRSLWPILANIVWILIDIWIDGFYDVELKLTSGETIGIQV